MKNQKRVDGTFEEFYENGLLKEKSSYKGGVKNGLRITYYENGPLAETITYKGGEIDGPFESYTKMDRWHQKDFLKLGKEGPFEDFLKMVN